MHHVCAVTLLSRPTYSKTQKYISLNFNIIMYCIDKLQLNQLLLFCGCMKTTGFFFCNSYLNCSSTKPQWILHVKLPEKQNNA